MIRAKCDGDPCYPFGVESYYGIFGGACTLHHFKEIHPASPLDDLGREDAVHQRLKKFHYKCQQEILPLTISKKTMPPRTVLVTGGKAKGHENLYIIVKSMSLGCILRWRTAQLNPFIL